MQVLCTKEVEYKPVSLTDRSFFTKDIKNIVTDTLPEKAIFHKNYLEYLESCWGKHLGIIINPDNIWHTLLTELSTIIKLDVEKYRGLFSKSQQKIEISVPSTNRIVLPVDEIVAALKRHLPIDASIFLPEFSTSTHNSNHAMGVALADACSPYYNYSMYLCNFPYVKIEGDLDDWYKLEEAWKVLSKHFTDGNENWINNVKNTLRNCCYYFNDVSWWKNIFKLERCGSGGQTEANGWFTDFYVKQPSIRFVSNFSTNISEIEYKDKPTNLNYKMRSGLFYSLPEDEFMRPDFGFIIQCLDVN